MDSPNKGPVMEKGFITSSWYSRYSSSLQSRVLVTNSLWVLPYVDEVFVLSDGKISERGTYKELIQFGGRFADLVATYLSEQKEDEEEDEAGGWGR